MKMKNLEKIEEQIRKNCTITVKAQIEEHLSPRDCLDAEGAVFVEREIEKGNEWAWCSVKVTVSYEGLSQDDYLGGCSYANKEEFMESGYMKDMVGDCIAQIRDKVINIIKPFINE